MFIFLSCNQSGKHVEVKGIIPKPNELVQSKGGIHWTSSSSIGIQISADTLKFEENYLKDLLHKATGVEVVNGKADFTIDLALNPSLADEEYTLNITSNKIIKIEGANPQGVFYGIQTLLQLIGGEVYQKDALAKGFSLPLVSIKDKPAFSYRGMHLDVSRHFTSKDDIKKFLDVLSHYKFNKFHWHLTDGSGWRLEIKQYPELTNKTTYRKNLGWKEFWDNGDRRFVDKDYPDAIGGYYTQDDVREAVAYAKDRHITIIPEIEMPGHSEEVFVAYPELSCSGIPYKDGDFCAGNEKSFEFIENVLTEVMDLFPSEYIHIGGDEAAKTAWKTCPKCKLRMKQENLKDVNELQSYFVKRVSNFLKSKNRKLIGWDEIVDGGLAEDATVMLWRDAQTAVKASKQGNDVIMTPGNHCYLDYYQSNPATEPEAIGGYLPIRQVYNFEVIPEGGVAERFLGGQGNLWTEFIPNYSHLEYMAFPRALAIAECVWTDKDQRDFEGFKVRLQDNYTTLEGLNVNYHRPANEVELLFKTDSINHSVTAYVISEQLNPIIRYTTDGSEPTKDSPLFQDSLVIKDLVDLSVAIMKDDQPQTINRRLVGYHKGIGKNIRYNKSWTSYPAGGETALLNGVLGGLSYSDRLWQGFTSDLDVVVDLGEVTEISTFNMRFMQLTNPGVYMPAYVEVKATLVDMKAPYVFRMENDIPRSHDRLIFKDFRYEGKPFEARYLYITAKNMGGFIFTDEIIIN